MSAATLSVGLSPAAGTVGDFNGDGKLDLAIANSGGASVSVFLGNGDGTFTLESTPTVVAPAAMAAGDLNGDGTLTCPAAMSFGDCLLFKKLTT